MNIKQLAVCALVFSLYLAGVCSRARGKTKGRGRARKRGNRFSKSKYFLHYVPELDANLHIDKKTVDGIKLSLLQGHCWEPHTREMIARNSWQARATAFKQAKIRRKTQRSCIE